MDESFGVAANKQGIRPKDYVLNDVSTALNAEISALREQIKMNDLAPSVFRGTTGVASRPLRCI